MKRQDILAWCKSVKYHTAHTADTLQHFCCFLLLLLLQRGDRLEAFLAHVVLVHEKTPNFRVRSGPGRRCSACLFSFFQFLCRPPWQL